MERMQAYIDFRTRLLTADKYFGIAPARRSRCVDFLVTLSGFEGAEALEAQDVRLLLDRYQAAVEEARGLVEGGELDAMELPLLEAGERVREPEPEPEQAQALEPEAEVEIEPEPEHEPEHEPELANRTELQEEPLAEFSLDLEPVQEQAQPVQEQAQPTGLEQAQGFSIELPVAPDGGDEMRTILPPRARARRIPAHREIEQRDAREPVRVESDLDAWELVATLAD